MKLFVFLVVVTIAAAVELPQSLKPQPQLPENIKELIEEHINYVLNHIKKDQKHKGQQHHVGGHGDNGDRVVGSQQVSQNVGQEDPHIPQVSNHQVTGSVVNRKVVQPTQVPTHVQEIVQQVHQHVPQLLSHHHQLQQQQQHQAHGQQVPLIVSRSNLNVPSHVQQIVGHVHQHVPQVLNHHHHQQQQQQQHPDQEHGQHVPQNVGVGKLDQNVPSLVQEIVGHVHQHVPQVLNHHHHQQQQQQQEQEQEHGQHVPQNVGVGRLNQKVPSLVQEIVGQVHQHVPQVLNQHHHQQQQQHQEQEHGLHVPQNVGVGRLDQNVPSHVQEIVGQVHQHVPQVLNHHHHQQQQQHQEQQQEQEHGQHVLHNVGKGKLDQNVPSHIQEIVGQVHQHIPQVIHHHHNQQQQQQAHGQHEGSVGKSKVNVPSHVQEIVEHIHQHVPQVVNQHLATKKPEVTDKAVVHSPTIHISLPGNVPHDVADKVQKLQQHVQEVMHHAQTHIPEVIKHQLEQKEKLKDEQKQQHDKEHKHEGRAGQLVPPKVQNVVQHIHQHIPQVINHHHQLQQQQKQQEHQLRLRKCDFQCDRNDLSVCASNGICLYEFYNQCELSKWNCLNTEKIFHQVADSECRSHHKRRCYASEMS